MRSNPSIVLFLMFATPHAIAVDVIAHRGYACSAGENSLQSVANAWLAGADAVEIDVRVSSDNVAYLFHDDEIRNTPTAELSYSEVQARIGKPVPMLSELLDVPLPAGYYVFDLKTNDSKQLDIIVETVIASELAAERVSFQSDDLKSLTFIRSRLPSAKLSYLTHLKWKVPYLIHPSSKRLAKRLSSAKLDRVSLKGRSFVDRDFVQTLKANGHENSRMDSERPGSCRTLS